MTARYISCADTAKLVRKELKENFPGIKFSVRSHTYAGGASIDIHYTDGPTEDAVNAVVYKFQGASFDGMTDLKSYHDGELNGEVVHFGANYVTPSRSLSIDFLTKVSAWYCKKFGYAMPVIKESYAKDGTGYIDGYNYIPQANADLATLIYREYRKIDAQYVDQLEEIGALASWMDALAYRVFYPIVQIEQEAARKAEFASMPDILEGENGHVDVKCAHCQRFVWIEQAVNVEGVWYCQGEEPTPEQDDAESERRYIEESQMSHEQLPWNQPAWVEPAEHAPYCNCPECEPGEPDEPENEQEAQLAQKIINKETVKVQVPSTGVTFTIRPAENNNTGLPAYDIIGSDEKVWLRGRILDKGQVREWCVGMVEVSEPDESALAHRIQISSAFFYYHDRCQDAIQARYTPTTLLLSETAINTTCCGCWEPLHDETTIKSAWEALQAENHEFLKIPQIHTFFA